MSAISPERLEKTFQQINHDAEAGGYHLNPDKNFTLDLIKGLLINQDRFGYMACPCRLAAGKIDADRDLVCPCDYRDPDLTDFDTCYCCLYVSDNVVKGEKSVGSIPERRPPRKEREKLKMEKENRASAATQTAFSLPLPVWRCTVCGYLCGREHPPETCPVCKVKKDRFEIFIPAEK
ncbi:MAG: ferredoxin-thioredoxin reductase catalytic domain-containing protein [Fibrobacterota bacterium]